MKKSKILLILFGIIVTIISVSSMLILNKEIVDTKFIVEQNSYGYEYAKNNNIEVLYDSNSNDYVKYIEEFIYNEITGGLEIIGYNGISKELVIPRTIDGKKVISINANLETVDRLVISENVKSLEVNLENKVLVCYRNELCEKSELQTEVIPDSEVDNYYFGEYEIEFAYNIVENEVEIKDYLGNNRLVIIPEAINGYKVTKVSLNIDKISELYIPKTINDIKLEKAPSKLSLFIIISILSLVVYTIVIMLVSNKKQSINNVPIYIVSLVYLVGLTIYSYLNFSDKLLIIIYIIATLIYIFISLALIFAKKKIEKFDGRIKNTGLFIKESLSVIEELKNNRELKDIKKLEDTVKYSDPVSNDATLDIEKEILDDLKNIEKSEDIELVIKKIVKRNKICKEAK